jgi:hypothetical protein
MSPDSRALAFLGDPRTAHGALAPERKLHFEFLLMPEGSGGCA